MVDVDAEGMLVLAALADSGGVRAAAQRLRVPRSTVSRRLAQLEKEVGAALVVRSSRRFAFTELGRALAERAARLATLLEEADELVTKSKAEPTGTLRIEAAPVLGELVLPEIASELVRKYPRLVVDVRLAAEYVDLRRGNADVALRASVLEDATDVYAVRVGTSITGCYASPAYLAERGVPEKPADLAHHACVLIGARTEWRLSVKGRDHYVAVNGRVHVDSFRVARDLAVMGAGIIWTARTFAAPFVEEGALVPILEKHWSTTPVYVLHASGTPAPAKIQAFVELARRVVPRALGS